MNDYYRSVVMWLQVLIVSLLIPFGHIVAQGVQLLRDVNVDTSDEVFVINRNMQYLYLGKLDLRPGDIIPRTDGVFSLGSPDFRWYAIYVDSIAFTADSIIFTDVGSGTAPTANPAKWGGTRPFLHTYSSSTSVGLNTFLGFDAGSLEMGEGPGRNTGIGAGALTSLTTGYENTAVGQDTLQANTAGFLNVGMGVDALFSNTVGRENVAIGAAALTNQIDGNDNVAVGFRAGRTETSTNSNLSGLRNVWIGRESGPGVSTTLNNSIGIGYRSHPVQSNQAIFGNSSITETLLYGNIGIGNSAPSSSLEISKSGTSSILTISAYSDTDTHAGTIQFKKSAGDGIFTSSSTSDGEALAQIQMFGVNTASTTSELAAFIQVNQDGTGGGARIPTKLSFGTGTSGATATSKFEILPNGFAHFLPTGTDGDAVVEVSSGGVTGGGSVHAASFAAHSSEKLKSDIRLLGQSEYDTAYTNIQNLRQYEYRYKVQESSTSARLVRDPTRPLMKGPVYEESPAMIQGERETISLNDRILQLEMALRIAIRKIESLEDQ